MKYQFDFEKPNKTPRTTKVAEDKQLVQKKIEEWICTLHVIDSKIRYLSHSY